VWQSSFSAAFGRTATTDPRRVAPRVEQGIRREHHECRHLLGAVVDQDVLDARGHDQGIQPFDGLALDFGLQMSVAFDDHVQGIGSLIRAFHVLLTRLQTDQLAHQARAVEELEPDRPLTQKLAAGAEIDDFHEILQGELARASARGRR
jgi:hypothetical protein